MTTPVDAADRFLSIRNAQACLSAFSMYMLDQYGFDINNDALPVEAKKIVVQVMTSVHAKGGDDMTDIKKLNDISLSVARDFYVKEFNLEPHGQQQRDAAVYGKRLLPPVMQVPSSSSTLDATMASPKRPVPAGLVPHRESTEDERTFLAKVDVIRANRNAEVVLSSMAGPRGEKDPVPVPDPATAEMPAPYGQDITPDPAALHRLQMQESDQQRLRADAAGVDMTFHDYNADAIIHPQASDRRMIEYYLAINGFDRDWSSQKQRFQFSIDLASGANTRNIAWIEVCRLVVPMETHDVRTIHNIPKNQFNYGFDLTCPYVALYIAEIDGVYENSGSAQGAQGPFCQLVFESSYISRNGRGYVICKPMSMERKQFYPNPMASLGRLSLSLLRPNGTLFNTSADSYMVWNVSWEPINPTYLRITTTKFFDRNEMYVGDTIAVTGFVLPRQADAVQLNSSYNSVMTFINRKEGHEILELAQPTDAGFFQGFHIRGYGEFDPDIGEFVVDKPTLHALNESNNAVSPFLVPSPNGAILNVSLQMSMTFKLGIPRSDASTLMDPVN